MYPIVNNVSCNQLFYTTTIDVQYVCSKRHETVGTSSLNEYGKKDKRHAMYCCAVVHPFLYDESVQSAISFYQIATQIVLHSLKINMAMTVQYIYSCICVNMAVLSGF
jgi:hypothetical protein